MTPHWLAHAFYILHSIEFLETSLVKVEDCPFADESAYRGAIQALQTLMESAYKLPDDIKARHSNVAWAVLKDFRNTFAHDYLVRPTEDMLIETIRDRLPPLKQAMLEHVPNWEEIKHEYRYI